MSGRFTASIGLLALMGVGGFAVRSCRGAPPPTPGPDPLQLLHIPFSHSVIDPKPLTGPDCCTDVLAIGDVNGDGRPDVVLGAQLSSAAGLVWYENPSWRRHDVANGEFTTDGKVADLNGDGRLDIIVGDEKSELTWFENHDNGQRWETHRIGGGYVHDIEVTNLDEDEEVEVVTCDKKELVLWNRDGSGRWLRRTLLASSGEGIALADLDADGDGDVVFGASWLENTRGADGWPRHTIATGWPADTRVRVRDMNADGRLDVVLSASEGPGTVSWFAAPPLKEAPWEEHRISEGELIGAHSLMVADLDGDGDLDVISAEMHTSSDKRVIVFVNDGAAGWRRQVMSTLGSHNMQAADLDGDGDVDFVGKNYAGPSRSVELWTNLTSENFGGLSPTAAPFVTKGWRYKAIDDARDDDQQGKMGLLGSDVNRDGRIDIVAGSFVYQNPGPDPAGPWRRARIGTDVDVLFALDADGDPFADLVGVRRASLLWIEAVDEAGSRWTERAIGQVADARTQGYIKAQVDAGGREELVFTRGTALSYLRVPGNPEMGPWPVVVVSTETDEEGVAAADIDGDGDADLAATVKGGQQIGWLENPGSGAGNWKLHVIGGGARIGEGDRFLDRIHAADVNGDGRIDVIASEETQDWTYNASIYWFEAPSDPRRGRWRPHRVAVLRSVNSLDVSDTDGDGDPDIVAAEHTDMRQSEGAPNNLTVIFENLGRGDSWRPYPVEAGPHSSHLGVRLLDLDGDGRLDLVSLGWNQFRHLHSWWRTPAPLRDAR